MVHSKKISVMHLGCPYLPYLGGSTTRLMNIVQSQDCDYLALSLITPTEGVSPGDDKGFECVLRTPSINKLMPSLKIFRFIKTVSPSIVVCHNSRVLLTWFLFYQVFFPKVRVIYELHSFRAENGYKELINKFLYKLTDTIVTLSLASKRYMELHYSVSNVEVIRNGLELKNEGDKRVRTYTPGNVTYAYVGSYHNWQGVNVISKAVSKLGREFWSKNSLYMIGSGPEFLKVESEIKSLGFENVHIYGWLGKSEINEILKTVDFLLAPRPSSLATETVLPLKVVDSINNCIPLIATNVGGLTEALMVGGEAAAVFIEKEVPVSSLVGAMKAGTSKEDYQLLLERMDQAALGLDTWKDISDKYSNLYERV